LQHIIVIIIQHERQTTRTKWLSVKRISPLSPWHWTPLILPANEPAFFHGSAALKVFM